MLRDSTATEKELLVAVEMAGSSVVVDDDLVGALLAVLRNSQVSEGVRGRAAIPLGPVLELATRRRFSGTLRTPTTRRSARRLLEATSMTGERDEEDDDLEEEEPDPLN